MSTMNKTGGSGTAKACPAGDSQTSARFRDLLKTTGGGSDRRNFLRLALLSAILFVVPVFFLDLPGGDETRVAGISAWMALDGDLLTPKLNGVPFLEYPPLYYAAAAACYRIFGIVPFAAKLPSALSAVAGVLLLYALMRFLRRPRREAFAGAFLLATSARYLTNAWVCRVDMMLAAFCILAWTGFVLMEFSRPGAARRFAGMVMLSAGFAGGLLTKNLPGLAIPLSGIGCTLLFCDLARRRFSFASYCRLAAAVLIGLIPYALYLLLLARRNGMAAAEEVFIRNNFGRFSGSHSDHSSPCWYYLLHLPEIFLPWLPFLLGGLFLRIREFLRNRSRRSIFQLSLLLVPFLMLSAASGKRMVYLLPLAAPAAMIAASAVPYIIRSSLGWFRGGVTVWICRRRRILLGGLALLIASAAGLIACRASHEDSYAPVFAEAERRLQAGHGRLVLVRPSERLSGAAVFYRRAVIPQLGDWGELKSGNVAVGTLRSKDPLPPLPAGFTAQRFRDLKLVLVFPVSP